MVRLNTVPEAPSATERARPFVLGAGYVLLLLVGLSLFAGGRADRYLTPFAVALVGLATGGLAQAVLEQRWQRRLPGPALGRSPAGVPSTLLVRAPWSASMRWWFTLSLVGPLAAWGVVALLERQWFWLAVALVCVAYLGLRFAPHGAPVGLHLTPEHLVLDDHGRLRTVPWSQVRNVVAVRRTYVRLHDGGKVHFVVHDLAVNPFLACLAIQVCVDDPELRTELGTPASLAWPVWGGSR